MDGQIWTEFGMNVLNAILPVIVGILPVLMGALLAWIVQLVRVQTANLKAMYPSQMETAEKIVAGLVKVAEQLNVSGLLEEKKQWVIDQAQAEFDEHGIKLSAEQLSNIIERAVFDEITTKFDAKKLDSTLKS